MKLRPPVTRDIESVVELSTAIDAKRPENPDLWRSPCQNTRLYIVDHGERLVGYGCARPDPGYPPETGDYRLSLGVAPEFRGRGAGTLLLNRLLKDLTKLGAHTARLRLQDSAVEAATYFKQRGFVEYQRMLSLVQDLSNLPPAPEVALSSVSIVTLKDELDQHGFDCLPAIHHMQNACFADVPTGEPFIAPTFESFQQRVSDPRLLHDCFFLAKDGASYVGISYAGPTDDSLGQWFTGVLPGYRGRGIAKALKWRITEYGVAHGFREVRTSTLQVNHGMRRANEALGFKVTRAEVRLRKLLTPGTARSGPCEQTAPSPASPDPLRP